MGGQEQELSDLDFYVAVEDECFEEFYYSLPGKVEAFYPIHLKIDFHVHTVSSAQGADPDHLKEMAEANWLILHNPEGILEQKDELPLPSEKAYKLHVEERLHYFSYIFAYTAQFIRHGDFWNSAAYLHSTRERMIYLYGIFANPKLMNDSYDKRLRVGIPTEVLVKLDALSFSDTMESQALVFVTLLDLFEKIAEQFSERPELTEMPRHFLAEVRNYITAMLQPSSLQ